MRRLQNARSRTTIAREAAPTVTFQDVRVLDYTGRARGCARDFFERIRRIESWLTFLHVVTMSF
jgi:hypothetical protein